MAIQDCIPQPYKTMITNMLAGPLDKGVISQVVASLPACVDTTPAVVEAAKEAIRRKAEQWPEAVLHLANGKTETGSMSGLFKATFGVPVTEDLVCR